MEGAFFLSIRRQLRQAGWIGNLSVIGKARLDVMYGIDLFCFHRVGEQRIGFCVAESLNCTQFAFQNS